MGWLVAAVFDGIDDEILEYLHEDRLVCRDDGEEIVGDHCAASRDAFLQVEEGLFKHALVSVGHGMVCATSGLTTPATLNVGPRCLSPMTGRLSKPFF